MGGPPAPGGRRYVQGSANATALPVAGLDCYAQSTLTSATAKKIKKKYQLKK